MSWVVKEEKGFRYVEVGEGPVLLLLHGLFGDLSNFHGLINEFSKTHKVLLPFIPLFEKPLPQSNLIYFKDFVHQFIEFKSIKKLTLIGNSLGGHIAILYTAEYPEVVTSLILTGSSGLFENSFGDTFPQRGNYEFVKNKTALTFYDPEVATKEIVDHVFEIVNNRPKVARLFKVVRSALNNNVKDLLKKITMPVLLIWGKNDIITPEFVGEEFYELLPNAELYFINECGHAPMMEHSDIFNQILKTFLDKLTTTTI